MANTDHDVFAELFAGVLVIIFALIFIAFVGNQFVIILTGPKIEYRPANPVVGEPVVFECVENSIEECKWNFVGKTGDEPGGEWERNGTSLHYTFSTAGVHAVTLEVDYLSGGPSRVTKRIHVKETAAQTTPSTSVSTPTKGGVGEGILDILRRVDPVVAIVASLLSILASITAIRAYQSW